MKTYSGWAGFAGERHIIGGDVFGIPVNSPNPGVDRYIYQDGRVQQVAGARELYEQPANLFIAGFIGSPRR